MDATDTSSSDGKIHGQDLHIGPNQEVSDDLLRQLQLKNESLVFELEALRMSYQSFQARSMETEEKIALLVKQREDDLNQKAELANVVEQISGERDAVIKELNELKTSSGERYIELEKRIDEESKENDGLRREVVAFGERIEKLVDDKNKIATVLKECLGCTKSVKECLIRIIKSMDEDNFVFEGDQNVEETELDEEMREFLVMVKSTLKVAETAEGKLGQYQDMRNKQKKELEASIVSLTEENRDVNSLLRIALVEKDAVEKNLNKLKGNNDQKRGAILQIAERGLQRVGFGFMMGGGANEPLPESSSASMKSDGSEGEEEVISLASTMERIMKNLRLEISQLRRSLEESRSDTERLQSLTEKQSHTILENTMYIRELEHRESLLAQHVEELVQEIKESEQEAARWREACELEVEAGKGILDEQDRLVSILKNELEKTKAALNISNGKLKLKEDLASAAMAVQAAAEKSLQLADSRATGLRERMEELTKQLEETEESNGQRQLKVKVRHFCWPFRILKNNNTNSKGQNFKRMLPEMQSLLQ
ncbi:uncharacterized protein At3g49055 [Impatiens glandulifera]|uniref:uncharacterized protein At3g49055 n=1 Tax=Impatiens glandulifera TaxID=253017 RepID=UPI001FB197AB|nr:uncharacterized protein At3g49055 [Impatiens glandulifera]